MCNAIDPDILPTFWRLQAILMEMLLQLISIV